MYKNSAASNAEATVGEFLCISVSVTTKKKKHSLSNPLSGFAKGANIADSCLSFRARSAVEVSDYL